MNTSLTKSFKAARRVSTPLIAIKTPDQAVTIETLKAALVNGKEPAILQWDAGRLLDGREWNEVPPL